MIKELNNIIKHTNFVFYGKGNIEEQIKEYSENLSLIEKKLKALEIIKELRCFTFYEIDNHYYISGIGMPKEIYDLLKEVLK